MSKGNKATERKLGDLHGAVAEALTDVITHTEDEIGYDDEGVEYRTGRQVHTAPPAMFAVAVKFLKDNDITCDEEASENVSNLRSALANKTKHSRLASGQASARLDS